MFSLIDQSVFSGATFIAHILLARSLLPQEYGAFAVAYALFLLASGPITALLLEPMSVLSPMACRDETQDRIRSLPWLYSGLTGVSVAILILVALLGQWILGWASQVRLAIAGATFAAPGIYAYWFSRRVAYLMGKPAAAAFSSIGYAILLAGSIFALALRGKLSALSAQLVMGGAGFACGALTYASIVSPPFFKSPNSVPNLVKQHWHYGRWVLASSLLFWLSSAVYTPLIGAVLGLEAAGAFRAVQNVFLPITQATTAFALLAMPLAAARWQGEGDRALETLTQRIVIVFIVAGGLYALSVLACKERVLIWLYGGEAAAYHRLENLVWPLSLATVLEIWRQGVSIGLAAAQKPEAFFWCRVISVISTVLIGLPLVLQFGVYGAAWGQLVSNATALWSLLSLKGRWLKSACK